MGESPPARPVVLLLEDDNALAEVVVLTLSDEFEIERAASAEEARMLLASREFDVLLCDHMMPGGQQGLDFLVDAMTQFPKPRRILLTGYMNPDLISRSVAVAGLTACLMKPVRMDDVRMALRQAVYGK